MVPRAWLVQPDWAASIGKVTVRAVLGAIERSRRNGGLGGEPNRNGNAGGGKRTEPPPAGVEQSPLGSA